MDGIGKYRENTRLTNANQLPSLYVFGVDIGAALSKLIGCLANFTPSKSLVADALVRGSELMEKIRKNLSPPTASIITFKLNTSTIVATGDLPDRSAEVSRRVPKDASSSSPLLPTMLASIHSQK